MRCLGCGTLGEVQIRVAVHVVVEPGSAGAHGFDDVIDVGAATDLHDIEPGRAGDVDEPERRGRSVAGAFAVAAEERDTE